MQVVEAVAFHLEMVVVGYSMTLCSRCVAIRGVPVKLGIGQWAGSKSDSPFKGQWTRSRWAKWYRDKTSGPFVDDNVI